MARGCDEGGVMMNRHTTPAHDRGGEGLNLCLCTVLQAIEQMIGMGGEGLNPLYMHGAGSVWVARGNA